MYFRLYIFKKQSANACRISYLKNSWAMRLVTLDGDQWPRLSSFMHSVGSFPIITANHLTSDPSNCFLSMPTVDILKIENQNVGGVRAETATLTHYNTAKDQ